MRHFLIPLCLSLATLLVNASIAAAGPLFATDYGPLAAMGYFFFVIFVVVIYLFAIVLGLLFKAFRSPTAVATSVVMFLVAALLTVGPLILMWGYVKGQTIFHWWLFLEALLALALYASMVQYHWDR